MSTSADALRRLVGASVAVHEAVAGSLGINTTDLRSLELIAAEPDMTPSRLADLTGLTSGAVTGILDRLEREGFVRRVTDPDDRRRLLVRPVPERMAAALDSYAEVIARTVEASEAWPLDDRDRIGGFLDDLSTALGDETARMWAKTRGGMVGDTYFAPVGEARRARLVMATGAPRLSIGGSALGQQVRMVAETAATRLHVRSGTIDELIKTSFVGPSPDIRTSGGVVTMRYGRRLIDTRSREVLAELNPALPWSIEVQGGLTDLTADLREVPLERLTIGGGVNHFDLRLSKPDGTVRLVIEGGTSEGRVSRPRGVPMALVARGGVSRLRFDGQRADGSGGGLSLRSPTFARSPNRYELEIGGGISDLVIRED